MKFLTKPEELTGKVIVAATEIGNGEIGFVFEGNTCAVLDIRHCGDSCSIEFQAEDEVYAKEKHEAGIITNEEFEEIKEIRRVQRAEYVERRERAQLAALNRLERFIVKEIRNQS